MKKAFVTIMCCLCVLVSFAQTDSKYGRGAVPVINGRVLIERHVDVLHADRQQVYEKATEWVEQRFVYPTVLKVKIIDKDDIAGRIVVNAEEYIVFRNTFFVLDRTRINYWLEITTQDNGYDMKMTRISYWYEEERDGGETFSAEEWITDEECFSGDSRNMLRRTGKFRCKTIDLADQLADSLFHEF